MVHMYVQEAAEKLAEQERKNRLILEEMAKIERKQADKIQKEEHEALVAKMQRDFDREKVSVTLAMEAKYAQEAEERSRLAIAAELQKLRDENARGKEEQARAKMERKKKKQMKKEKQRERERQNRSDREGNERGGGQRSYYGGWPRGHEGYSDFDAILNAYGYPDPPRASGHHNDPRSDHHNDPRSQHYDRGVNFRSTQTDHSRNAEHDTTREHHGRFPQYRGGQDTGAGGSGDPGGSGERTGRRTGGGGGGGSSSKDDKGSDSSSDASTDESNKRKRKKHHR